MKTGCLIYFYGKKYENIGLCALNSFKKHHPEIMLHHVNEFNESEYEVSNFKDTAGCGVYKYMLAVEIMKKNNYEKFIILGADTITCARLDEFLDDNEHDILASLDYPYQLSECGIILSPNHETHLNADVVCFNKIRPIIDIIKISKNFPAYAEQGGLNYVAWSNNYKHSCKIVDGPYLKSNVVYNVRSKGNMCLPYEYQDHSATTGEPPKFPPYEKPWGPHLNKFYVKDKKLYTKDHKQIKVWHYCEGLGNLNEENFVKIMNNYIFKWFNKETKQFFKEQCGADDFFEKEFTL